MVDSHDGHYGDRSFIGKGGAGDYTVDGFMVVNAGGLTNFGIHPTCTDPFLKPVDTSSSALGQHRLKLDYNQQLLSSSAVILFFFFLEVVTGDLGRISPSGMRRSIRTKTIFAV